MVKQAVPKLAPQDAIAEIESSFVDQFKDFIQETRGEPLPDFRGYPTVMCITRQGMKVHEGRDTDSYMKLLEKIQSIPKPPTPMKEKIQSIPKPPTPMKRKTRKVQIDPRLQLVEYEDPDKGKGSRKRRKRRARRT